ncbi:hypothetical protein [Staphylococcus devriesei]|nr:hypothetical protein [Staphylococcus devriesei]
MRALRREHTKHFQMSYINDDKDYSIPLEQREKETSNKKEEANEKEQK